MANPNTTAFNSHRLCVAPMLDWTDRHARYFLRLISPHAYLYSEMVTTGAIIHGDAHKHLELNDEEHPVALQLGGSNPKALAEACKIAEDYTYNEINLNIGCPSDRVQSGKFGACLMAEPDLVAECIDAMQKNSSKLVTVKCRIGIDEQDSFEFLQHFIETVAKAPCDTFIIHARKAILSGLSPKENREIPPLHYDRAYKIKELFPNLNIVINGGIKQLDECITHLQHTDGVMIGREAYHNPYCLAEIDNHLFNSTNSLPSRHAIIENMLPYIDNQLANGVKLNHISRHILGIFNGLTGAKAFRRYISENAHTSNAGTEVILHALSLVPEAQ